MFAGLLMGCSCFFVKGRKITINSTSCGPEIAPSGTPLSHPKIPPKKFMWVPGNEAYKLFSGGPKWGVLGGGQKVYVDKVYVFFCPAGTWDVPGILDPANVFWGTFFGLVCPRV